MGPLTTICACSLVVKPGRGHAEWCDYGLEKVREPVRDEALTPDEVAALAEAGVDDGDWEYYRGNVSVTEAVALRKVGVIGSAYRRYQEEIGMEDLDEMGRLAAVGISSVRYAEWKKVGISDVDRVTQIHMAGFNAEGYLELLEETRSTLGAALGERVLESHCTPVETVEAVKKDPQFGNWLLYLKESALREAVWRCEAGEWTSEIVSSINKKLEKKNDN